MRKQSSTVLRAFALAASLGLVAAACGSSDGDSESSSSTGSGALDGVSITVGSKDFTENILLGQMLIQGLENEGAKVTDQTNLGGTSVNREALLSEDITVYPDYNGTGWTVHLAQEDPSSDPQELFDVTAEKDLADNNIKWVGLSPFNDTYGFVANGDLNEQEDGFDMQGMADYLEANSDASLCLETEFPDRPDGLVLFEEATGFTVPQGQIQILDTGLIYTETAQGGCDFGEVFTTDGRITELNIDLVEDPGVFILYNASYTWNADAFNAYADDYTKLIDEILAPLDEDKMAELNAQVDVAGESADDVAKQYLQEIGVL